MAERLKAAVLKTAKGSQPFVGSNPTSSVAKCSLSGSQVWRDGREAEGTGLLNLHIRKGIEGSNPSLSAPLHCRGFGGRTPRFVPPVFEISQVWEARFARESRDLARALSSVG